MSTFVIYYLETNLICMLFMAFVLYSYLRESRGLAEAKWFVASIVGVIIYCGADILAACYKNQTFTGARVILWASNTIYITMPLMLAMIWQRYTTNHMQRFHMLDPRFFWIDRIFLIASLVVAALSFSSPVTHFSFYLDEMNGYHRSWGAYVVPVLSYVFLMVEWVKARLLARESQDLEARAEARAMSLLPIPCVAFSLLQVFYYGITTAQVGFTMGFLIVFLIRQQNAISRDELTGLNNRRQYELAVEQLSRSTGSALVAMIDIDGFKNINDTWGHAQGDEMLKAVSVVLRHVCQHDSMPGKINAFRYGGDEFAILASSPEDIHSEKLLMDLLDAEVARWNEQNQKKYSMSLSVGCAYGRLGEEEIHQLIERADKAMYVMKNKRKEKAGT